MSRKNKEPAGVVSKAKAQDDQRKQQLITEVWRQLWRVSDQQPPLTVTVKHSTIGRKHPGRDTEDITQDAILSLGIKADKILPKKHSEEPK